MHNRNIVAFIFCMVMFIDLVGFKQDDGAKNLCYSMNAEVDKMNTVKVKPLPSKLKEILKREMTLKEMTFKEIEDIIGPCHDVFGSGVSWLVWYFDDDTCLVIFCAGKRYDKAKEWFWYKCKPGEFNMNVLKDKNRRVE